DQIRTEAEAEAERTVESGQRELEVLERRQENINAEISRVQDVLEALESFETPGSGGGAEGGSGKKGSADTGSTNGVAAGVGAGTTRSGGKDSGN
ncbi:MAG TPA: hypothetical protein VNS49_17555, partial [Streptomyces sp.]|nr:hypothetical protein [Streptomyces sp.]